MIAGVLYLTQGARVEVFGINFFAMRFLELAGIIRVTLRKEFSLDEINNVDRVFVFLYFYTMIVSLLHFSEFPVYRIGVTVDAIFCYFTFRGLIKDYEDLEWLLRALVALLVPFLILLFVERLTAYNPFSIVGGSSEALWFRHGIPRCIGSFRHPDLLGTLGASFLPLYIALAFGSPDRVKGAIGILLCLAIVWLTNSGGPVIAAAVGSGGWVFWRFRTKTSLILRCIVALFVILALFMKAPIWYLPDKLSSITGGHGWHRSYLMDIAFKNLGKWWLCGMRISETKDWFPYTVVSGGADITNQYISFGIAAGLAAIGLFTLLLVRAFRTIGIALRAVRDVSSKPVEKEFILWGLGVMLLVHVINWFGVTYYDQTSVLYYMQLAAISSLGDVSTLSGKH
ncbi:MAG: hypothetical protein JRH08_04530 [Deltaproteobacteria bacterium]|nr:hypothetical protein [Deltaproteobacteria bacterium]MBW2024938.1 hypothetical protein [Deltaproteobacteria bacterium]MBW2124967.1 hypothetical protein [Deltaproteobacteria bacterium]